MAIKITNAAVYSDGVFKAVDTLTIPSAESAEFNNCIIIPGFADVHVHLREPGFSYKETIKSGSLAAASAGYTCICPMPNLNPAPDCEETLKQELDIIERDACIDVLPYGTITMKRAGRELADMEAMADKVCAFSDDGSGVQDDDMMREAMKKAKSLGKMIAAHCEVNSLLNGGYIHDGEYAKAHGHKGICSESEWGQIKRDIELVRETGCDYHVCHISTKESVELIRNAKKEGLSISCETGPHYLIMNDSMLQEHGRFKMNPPIRSEEDRLALIEGIKDGTIDMIATDHAPHSAEEKGKGLAGSAMGVVGIETAFPLMYTYLVKPGIITLEKLIELMCINPRKRFDIGCEPGTAIYDLSNKYTIDPAQFVSMGRSTPFEGWEVYGRCLATINSKGETVCLREQI